MTCSMALGDTGITPLEHVGGYAHFASGGLSARPYGIDTISTLQNQIVYNRDADEPPRKQVLDRKVVETLNTMLQGVVLNGTGKAAQLDYTNSAGKTGTSSNYRDAWFIGFTGQYVAGVWLGNDDFTPMSKVTGGSFPAQTWHNFMVAAHDTDNIPTIPGLPVHPVQQSEQARLALNAPAAAPNADLPAPSPESVKDMPSATKALLEKLGTMLKGAPPLTPSDKPGEHRAEAPPAAIVPSNPSVPAANGAANSSSPATGTQTATAPQTSSAEAANGGLTLPP
jgi:penicillin-binding protein 1A